MAKIAQGILNETTGKVGPVICSTIRGINYIRAYVKPVDPERPAQKIERAAFTFIMNICKYNYLTVIKSHLSAVCAGAVYTPWNYFFMLNKSRNLSSENLEVMQFSDGGTGDIQSFDFFRNGLTNLLYFQWSTATDQFRKQNDKIELYLFDKTNSILSRVDTGDITRSAGLFLLGEFLPGYENNLVAFGLASSSTKGFSLTAGKIPHTVYP